jgi:hypothetical protein
MYILLESEIYKGLELVFFLMAIKMARRLLQLLLIVSLFCGAAAQALGCISMMQSENHACCRLISSKKTSQKLRKAPAAPKNPTTPLHCCDTSSSSSHQAPLAKRELRQDEFVIAAADEVTAIVPGEKRVSPPSRLLTPTGYSPPPFILYHSLLI